jgi:predicted aspartyl protease
MIPYDKGFSPPAIVLPVTLTGVVQIRPSANVQGLIDTGADVTAVPASLKEQLGLYPSSAISMLPTYSTSQRAALC